MTTTLREANRSFITEAFAILGIPSMDTREARVMLLTIGLQESRFLHTRQLNDGPARGYWQFERGTQASKGGVWGVYLHPASRGLLERLCASRLVAFDPRAIWEKIEADPVLAAGVARLLLWTDSRSLPSIGDHEAGWGYYLRNWNPGKPHPATWRPYWNQARAEVLSGAE